MENFFSRLGSRVASRDSMLCIGLDSDVQHLPSCCRSEPNPQLFFNRQIIEATADLVCTYKINLAFYESEGTRGWDALEKTRALIPSDIPVIGDAKRADIGNTSKHYARALFDVLGFDAITVNPYMGSDSLTPFFEYKDRGVFVLCLTSNPGAGEFQIPNTLFLNVARHCRAWHSTYGTIGLVTGAPYPEQLSEIRDAFPEGWFLVPGVGAQGGDLTAVITAGIRREDAAGLIINVSRSVIFASKEQDFAEHARRSAEETVKMIRNAKGAVS